MRGTTLFVSFALVFVALAGCAGDAPVDEDKVTFDDLQLTATQDTGVIRGVVFDDAIRPLADATVTVSGNDIEDVFVTTATGTFGFQGLAAGTYFLKVEKPGFTTTQTSTEVIVGVAEPDMVKILLEGDPSSLPFVQVYQFDGFIECSFSLVVVGFAACSAAAIANDDFLREYTYTRAPNYLQSEMTWQSTQTLGDEMSLSFTDFSQAAQVRINATAGVSPVVVGVGPELIAEFGIGTNNTGVWRVFNDAVDETDVVPEEVIHDAWAGLYPTWNSTAPQEVKDEVGFLYSEDCIKYPALFDACLRMGGVGATIEQEFQVFTHAFYGFDPVPGWQFSVDGAPSVPTA